MDKLLRFRPLWHGVHRGRGGGVSAARRQQLLLCLSSSDVAMLANDLVVWQWLGLSVLTNERKITKSVWPNLVLY